MPLRAKFVSLFDKQIDVLTTSIIGTAKCKKTEAVVHAANVWAQWQDWRQTGAPGNPSVATSLSPKGKGVVITMFANDDDPAQDAERDQRADDDLRPQRIHHHHHLSLTYVVSKFSPRRVGARY